jgi:hypothetical protein
MKIFIAYLHPLDASSLLSPIYSLQHFVPKFYVLSYALRTTPRRLAATAYSTLSQLPSISGGLLNSFSPIAASLMDVHSEHFTFGSVHVEVRWWSVRRGGDVSAGQPNMGIQALQQPRSLHFSFGRQRLADESFCKKPSHVCGTEIINNNISNDSDVTTNWVEYKVLSLILIISRLGTN